MQLGINGSSVSSDCGWNMTNERYFYVADEPLWPRASSYPGFTITHTHTHTAFGSAPLDK